MVSTLKIVLISAVENYRVVWSLDVIVLNILSFISLSLGTLLDLEFIFR